MSKGRKKAAEAVVKEERRLGKVPELSWRLLSVEELEEIVKRNPHPLDTAMLKLVKKEKARAWLDDEGVIRYQYKPESLRKGE